MWRLAELMRRDDDHLDVIVMNEESDGPNKINGVGNSKESWAIGVCNFRDKRSPDRILKDFATAHSTPLGIYEEKNHTYTIYPTVRIHHTFGFCYLFW